MNPFLEEVSDQLNLRWAWEKVRREATPGDIWFDEIEMAGFELELESRLRGIGTALRKGRYRLAPLRPLPFPKHPDKYGKPRIRQAFQLAVRDQVAWTAVINVVGPYVDDRMPAWSYGNRLYRSIWVKEDTDGIRRRLIGNYRHASGRLFLPFSQSWPIFRRHVYLSTRAMTSGAIQPGTDERTKEELELQESLNEERRCPFVRSQYWKDKRPEGSDLPLYWCSIDLEKFYPTLRLAPVRDNIVEALPSEWQKDAGRLLESMLRFPLDTCEWDLDQLKKMDLRPANRTFRHIPTGLYVAGFLANAGLLKVDAEVVNRLRERNVAHFRFVDDHIILAYSFEELTQWVDEYARLLRDAATGARVNPEKVEPKALGDWFRGRKRKRKPISMEGLERAARTTCELDPNFPSPLMTKTLALVSGIARTDFNLLDTAELTNLTEQLEQLLLVDLPEEEIPEKTRLSFAASRLSRVAACRLANNDATAHLNSRRDAMKAEQEGEEVSQERRQEIDKELAEVERSLRRQAEMLHHEVNQAFQLIRKVLRERPDRVRLWTRAVLMCRLTGVKGLRDIVDDINRERLRSPLAGEYLLANTLALLGGQALVAARILRDRNVARWRRQAAQRFLEDVRDTQVPIPDPNRSRRFLQLSSDQYCCGLHCASLVLAEWTASGIQSPNISFDKGLNRAGQECVRQGAAERGPEEWAWWAARKTLRDMSSSAGAFVMELGNQLPTTEAAFGFWRFFPSDTPLSVLMEMAVKHSKDGEAGAATGGWWVDALRNRSEVSGDLYSRTRNREIRRACRMVRQGPEDSVTLYEWCSFLHGLQGERSTDPRGGEWTALEITIQIAELIEQAPVFGPSYIRDASKGAYDLPHVHPANFRVPRSWIEDLEVTWEEWKRMVRGTGGARQVVYADSADRIADARYTPITASTSVLFQSVNPVRGLGLILYGLLKRDFALPSMWNGPGHADVLGMLPPLLLQAMTCSSWTMGVLQGCLLPRVTENQLLLARPLDEHIDDDTLRDPTMFFSASEVGAALRRCKRVLEEYQLSTFRHRARQLIPVSIRQLAAPEWGKVFSSDTEPGGQV